MKTVWAVLEVVAVLAGGLSSLAGQVEVATCNWAVACYAHLRRREAESKE